MSLRGKSVVVTRSEADADDLKAQLEGLGASVTVVPSIVLEPLPVDGPMRDAMTHLDRTAWIAFASRQAVHCWCDALEAARCTVPTSVKLAAVGPGTGKALATRLRDPDLVAQPSSAEGLAKMLIAAARPNAGRMLLPAGAKGRVVLRDRLVEAGFSVCHLIMYDTHPATAADGPVHLPATVDYVLFTSPSTVEGFLARSAVPRGASVVTIGPTTSAAVRARGLRVEREAREHSLDGLVQTLTE